MNRIAMGMIMIRLSPSMMVPFPSSTGSTVTVMVSKSVFPPASVTVRVTVWLPSFLNRNSGVAPWSDTGFPSWRNVHV